MTVQLITRRSLVVAGAVAALVVGAASIQVAAAWTAATAPLNDPPASLASLQASLDGERARSDSLDKQLQILAGASADLARTLDAAQGQVASDAANAEQLRASLAAAKDKLARLEGALANAAQARGATTSPIAQGADDGVASAENHEDEHHENEPDRPGDD